MARASNMRMAVRIAILRPNPASDEALLFEVPRACSPSSLEGSVCGGCANRAAVVQPGDGAAEVLATRLALGNTLLASAVKHRQARFVRDCGSYMQVCDCVCFACIVKG